MSCLKTHFLETWSQGRKIPKCCPCILVWMVNPPHPSTSWPPTSHNNNNGGLHACVRATENIEPIRVTRTKYSAPLPLRWVKKDYGQLTSHFWLLLQFLLLLSVCIQCTSFMHAPSPLLRFCWISCRSFDGLDNRSLNTFLKLLLSQFFFFFLEKRKNKTSSWYTVLLKPLACCFKLGGNPNLDRPAEPSQIYIKALGGLKRWRNECNSFWYRGIPAPGVPQGLPWQNKKV